MSFSGIFYLATKNRFFYCRILSNYTVLITSICCYRKLGIQGSNKKKYQPTADTFLYFAYGSNLLKKRIRVNNSSAEFIGIGKLENYQLDFISFSKKWRGATATIIPAKNAHVWGAIWRLHVNDMAALDKQEGVAAKWYFAKTVDVVAPEGDVVQCRTYQQLKNPTLRNPGEDLPAERRPSLTYMKCIIDGAKECSLPSYYIEELKNIPHNGQTCYRKK